MIPGTAASKKALAAATDVCVGSALLVELLGAGERRSIERRLHMALDIVDARGIERQGRTTAQDQQAQSENDGDGTPRVVGETLGKTIEFWT